MTIVRSDRDQERPIVVTLMKAVFDTVFCHLVAEIVCVCG